MSINSDLYNTLNTTAGVRSLVGISSSPQQSRIYPGVAPESATLPYIDYETLSRFPISTIKGVSDVQEYTVRIGCNATTHTGANALADAVFAALEGDGYQDNRYDFYDESTKIHSTTLEWAFIA